MSLEISQESVPAIIRVRRKRTAPASSGWTLSSKRNRMDDGCSIGDEENQMVFKLAATAPGPSISNVTDLALPSKIALVEYDMENGVVIKKGIVDEEQEKTDAVADMVEKMDVSDSLRKNEAPLASNESLNDTAADQQWVYDFYYGPKLSSFSSVQIDLNQEISIRQATDEELQLMFMDDDDDDSNAFQDDDADSNAENNPNNDYPDEGEFNEYHETTSEDSYDHYGDEEDIYNDYLDEEGEDDNDY